MKKILLLLMFVGALCCADGMELVRDGKAVAGISVSDKAAPCEKFAAAELRRVVEKISGAKLPGATAGKRIVIGTPNSNPEIAARQKELKLAELGDSSDGFVIQEADGNIYAAANSARGAMYAVFALLEQIGCRWYWAGTDGEFLPDATKNLSLTVKTIVNVPDIRYRRFLGRFSPEVGKFMAHSRMNMADISRNGGAEYGMVNSWGGHSFNWIFPADCKTIDEYFKKYPDHFALNNGVRIINQHCYTNPAVRAVFSAWIDRFWQTHPEVEMLVLAPRDTPHFCQCATCAKMDGSTLAHTFFADLINDAEKKHPKKLYRTLAYSFYKDVPKNALPKNQIMEFCMYGRCYKHAFGTDKCTANEREKTMWEAWRRKGVPIGIYGYHYDALAGGDYFLPLAPVMGDEIKAMKKAGTPYWSTELFQYTNTKGKKPQEEFWYVNRFSIYVVTRLLWDSSLNVDDLLREFTTRTFGAAAGEMADYYRLMHGAWQGTGHLSYYFNNPRSMADDFMTAEVVAKADVLLAKAAVKVKNSPRCAAAVAADTQAYKKWRDMAQDRDNWKKIAAGEMPQRLEALKRATPGKVLYGNDFAGEIREFNDKCAKKAETGVNYLAVRPAKGENFIFGNHPRIFGRPCNWMNYNTSFRFRFPADGGKNPNVILCVRSGGQRFNDHNFYYYYVTISPAQLSCSVRERNRKAAPATVVKMRDLKMAPLETGKWYQADVRAIDNNVVVSIDGKVLMTAAVPLGGGAINMLCPKPVDLAGLEVREIAAPSQAEQWRVSIPKVSGAPQISGDGKDKLWDKGYTTSAFVSRNKNNRQVKSEVTLLYNDKALYMRFVNRGDGQKINSNQQKRDDDQWKDDCVEISLDPANSRTDYYYLVVNPSGVQFDALASAGMNINKAWNGKWRSVTTRQGNDWILEVELPFAAFGGEPKPGAVWLLGLNRSGENIRQSWTDGSFHSPNSFRTIEFAPEAAK